MMKERLRFGWLAALCATGLALAAQDTPPQPEPEPQEAPEITPELLFPEDPVRQEIIELFHEVERKLAEIDGKLLDAGAGDIPLSEVEDSGLDDLLRSTESESESVVQDIDRILELAAQLGGQSVGSGMSPPSQPQGQSPLDQERDRGPMEREETPEDPSSQEGEEPQPNEQESQDPQGDQRDEGPGENRDGNPPNSESGDPSASPDDASRWGDLPVRFRETFRSQGGEDVPVQYRDWVDTYYRRLNKPR